MYFRGILKGEIKIMLTYSRVNKLADFHEDIIYTLTSFTAFVEYIYSKEKFWYTKQIPGTYCTYIVIAAKKERFAQAGLGKHFPRYVYTNSANFIYAQKYVNMWTFIFMMCRWKLHFDVYVLQLSLS